MQIKLKLLLNEILATQQIRKLNKIYHCLTEKYATFIENGIMKIDNKDHISLENVEDFKIRFCQPEQRLKNGE